MNFSEETIHDRAVGFLLVFTQRNSKCGSKETLWAILIPKSNLELLLYIIRNGSQWNTTSASFINTLGFMSLLDNHQLKTYRLQHNTIKLEWRHSRRALGWGPVIDIRWSHPAKTFDVSHLSNILTEQLILNAWRGSACEIHCQISEKGPTNMVYSSNVWYPPSDTRTQMNLCLNIYNPSVVIIY